MEIRKRIGWGVNSEKRKVGTIKAIREVGIMREKNGKM